MNKPFNHNQGTPNLAKINVNLRFGKKKKKKKVKLNNCKKKNKKKKFQEATDQQTIYQIYLKFLKMTFFAINITECKKKPRDPWATYLT